MMKRTRVQINLAQEYLYPPFILARSQLMPRRNESLSPHGEKMFHETITLIGCGTKNQQARVGDRTVGSIVCKAEKDLEDDPYTGYIAMLAVDTVYRKHGIGEHM